MPCSMHPVADLIPNKFLSNQPNESRMKHESKSEKENERGRDWIHFRWESSTTERCQSSKYRKKFCTRRDQMDYGSRKFPDFISILFALCIFSSPLPLSCTFRLRLRWGYEFLWASRSPRNEWPKSWFVYSRLMRIVPTFQVMDTTEHSRHK